MVTEPIEFALIAVAAGLGLLALVFVALRLVAPRAPEVSLLAPAALPMESTPETGLVVAQQGGKLLYANERARQFFGLNGEAVSLNSLARRVTPSDSFLELFAATGSARLNVEASGRQLEATSLHLPGEAGRPSRVVVLLKEAGRALYPNAETQSLEALRLIAELNREIAAQLELPDVLRTSLDCVGRAYPYDAAEINLWDAAEQVLRPARIAGRREYARLAMRNAWTYRPGEYLTGYLAERREPLIVGDLRTFTLARPRLAFEDLPARAYAGFPLLAGDEFLGTLELVSFTENAYRPADEPLLLALAEQTAVAIRNAYAYAAQQRRADEFASLAEITRATEATADPRELYRRLTDAIARLLKVDLVGFLLYDERERALIPQPPFHGVPDAVLENYRLPLPSSSPAERLWREAPYLLCNDLRQEPVVEALGLRELVELTGARATLMAPVTRGEKRLGVVQVCHNTGGAAFTEAEAHLLCAFANQAAVILENARLVREAEARAAQAEELREIAVAAAEGTDLDSSLRLVMARAARLFQFDVGLIALLDETRGELRPHPASVYGAAAADAADLVIYTDDPQFAYSVTRTRRPFISGNAPRDRRILKQYRPGIERYGAQSVMAAPLVVGDRSIGEFIIMSRRVRAYSKADLRLLATVAAQVASTIDRARLHAATDQNLQRRVEQLTALTRIGRELNRTLELTPLVRLVREELLRITPAADVSIVVLAAAAPGAAPRVALRIGAGEEAAPDPFLPYPAPLTTAALSADEEEVVTTGRALNRPGPAARLFVPIMEQDEVVGVITLIAPDSAAFDETTLETASALAAQTAIAVANARRYDEQIRRSEQLRRRADQLAQLLELARTVRSDRPLADNLEAIAFGLQEAVGFNVVNIHLLEPQTRRTRRVVSVGLPLSVIEETRHVQHAWENIERLMRDEFRLSQSYFLPQERAAHLTVGLETIPMPGEGRGEGGPFAWHPDDLLIVPLQGAGAEPLGFISLDDPRDGQRPTRAVIEVVEIFANQAAQTIENVRLYQAVERRAQRLLALHHVTQRLPALTTPDELLQTIAEALLREMKLDVVVIAFPRDGRLAPVARAGAIRPEINLEALLRQANPLAHAIDQEFAAFSTNVRRSDWETSPLIILLRIHSFMCVPLSAPGWNMGALFAGAQSAENALDAADLELFNILANQLSARLESLQLERDIQMRATQLAALAEASRQMTATLRSEDVVQAVLTHLRSVVPYDSLTLWLRSGDARGRERRAFDRDVLRIAAAQGFENDAERLGLTVAIDDSALFAEMARTGQAVIVRDTHADPRFPGGEYQLTRSWLGAPLIAKGQVIGALTLDAADPDFYTPSAAQLLMAFANQAAAALDNARLFEENVERGAEITARSQRLALLNRVSAELSGTLDPEAMFGVLLRELLAAVGVERAAAYDVATLDAEAFRAIVHTPPGEPPLPLPTALVARIQESLAPVMVDDLADEPLLSAPDRAMLEAAGVRSLLVMPLVAARTLVAVVLLAETQGPRSFATGEIELVQTLANQAAVAIQNARLFDEVQLRAAELGRRNERMRALNTLSSTLSSTLEAEILLREAAEQLVEMFGADHVSMLLMDELSLHAVLETEAPLLGARGLRLPPAADAMPGQVLARRVVLVRELAEDTYFEASFRARLGGLGVRSLLLAPFVAQGRPLGAFTLESFSPRSFTTDEIELCQTIAAQIASALTNAFFARDLEKRVAQRTEELSRERDRVETLLQITSELSSSLELDRVLHRALQLVTEAVGATQGSIFTVDPETDQLIYRAALGSPKVLPPGGEPAPLKKHEGLVGWVMKNRQAVVIHNLETDTRWKKLPAQKVQHKSALAVPLMANEEVLGALILYSPLDRAFDEEQKRLVMAAANQVGAATNNAELYRILREQAERLGSLLRIQQVETTKNRAILEGIADGVLVTDSEGRISLLNTACERLLSLKREQTVGRPIADFIGLFGAGGRALFDSITAWSNEPQRSAPGDVVTERVELEDSQRILLISVSPVTTSDEYLGTVALIRDITREVEVDRLKTEFVTNVSHELLTPLTVIKGYTDVLLMGAAGPVSPMQAKSLDLIRAHSDRLNLLVKDLLDRARIESGKVQLVLGPLSVRDILNTVVETVQAQMVESKKTMNLHVDVPADLPSAWGDHMRLTQVLSNLAENAYNYTPADGTITLRARLAGPEIIIEVSDTGIGIPEEQRRRLFDRFFRGDHPLVMATSGAGLGLSIARQLTEMQGGRLWLKESVVDRGSTFAVALPVATPEKIKELAVGAR
jgi:PAS domain S-box-containing protein